MFDYTIEIPVSCALRCRHCSHDYPKEDSIDHPELEENEIEVLLDGIPKPAKIRISGGEPFRNPDDLFYILEAAKERSLQTEVLSSGVYSTEEIEYRNPQPIPEAYLSACLGLLDNIGFSLHGNKETHDLVTQVRGSFDCLIKSVKATNVLGLPFSFHMVPMRITLPALEDALVIVKYWSNMAGRQIPFRLLRFINQGEGKNFDLALNEREVRELRARVPYLAQKYGVNINMSCSLLEKGCSAGVGRKVSTTIGEFPCSALKGYKGELPEKDGRCACSDRW